MKNIVKFNCIEISEHPISYEINSLFGFFKVIGNRGESLASKEYLEDAAKKNDDLIEAQKDLIRMLQEKLKD